MESPHPDFYTFSYTHLHARDLPLIHALGANVIRIFHWSDSPTTTVQHLSFLDMCWKLQIYVVLTFKIGGGDMFDITGEKRRRGGKKGRGETKDTETSCTY